MLRNVFLGTAEEQNRGLIRLDYWRQMPPFASPFERRCELARSHDSKFQFLRRKSEGEGGGKRLCALLAPDAKLPATVISHTLPPPSFFLLIKFAFTLQGGGEK